MEVIYGNAKYTLDHLTGEICAQRPYDKSRYVVDKNMTSITPDGQVTVIENPLYRAILNKATKENTSSDSGTSQEPA